MIRAYTVAEIRAAEAALMATVRPGTLMQRAAAGLAAVCARVLNGPYGARVTIIAGTGDNGGDALWAGARLARRGAHVEAIPVTPDRVHEQGLAALEAAGGRIADDERHAIARADLVLDGMLGIGGRGGLSGRAADLAALATAESGLVVAVDLPSGIEPDTGETTGPHVVADITVTFGAYKIGTLIDPAAQAVGRLTFVDIGLAPHLDSDCRAQPGVPPEPLERPSELRSAAVEALEIADVAGLLPRPTYESDKYRRGVIGVRTGSDRYTGAAVLSVGGAVHGGAGMVRYAGPARVADLVRDRWPEVVAAADPSAAGRVQAWTVGSGLGEGDDGQRDVETVLGAGVPVLLDADALRHLPDRVDGTVVITPHAGELARLLGVDRAAVEARRLHHARSAAQRWNVTTLLKGSTTIIGTPDGRARVNRTGTPALATAGTGDVLAGLVGSLLAAGLSPLDAASVGAYLHGEAGRVAAAQAGYPSADDVLHMLPGVVAAAIR